MAGTEPIDRRALQRIESIGGSDLIEKLVELFRAGVPPRLAAARVALAHHELAGVREALHSVVSSAANLGATELDRLAREGERQAAEGDVAGLAELLDQVDEAYARVDSFLAAPGTGGSGVRTVAVVEDNADNRLLVRAILEPACRIVEYTCGEDAIVGCRAHPPDVILLDMSLPGVDGAEVLQALRADPALDAVPIIALTAHAMAGAREEHLRLGFDDYISKPIVDPRALRERVTRPRAGCGPGEGRPAADPTPS